MASTTTPATVNTSEKPTILRITWPKGIFLLLDHRVKQQSLVFKAFSWLFIFKQHLTRVNCLKSKIMHTYKPIYVVFTILDLTFSTIGKSY